MFTRHPGRYAVITLSSLVSRSFGKENPIVKTTLARILLFVYLFGGSSASLLARGFSGNCSGTYLMDEAGGATSLWTFEADGTFSPPARSKRFSSFPTSRGAGRRRAIAVSRA